MKDPDCFICGMCWWQDCPNDADYTMDVQLKRKGTQIYDGKVQLCGGHTRLVHSNGGRMDLKPQAIEQANSLKRMERAQASKRVRI